MITPLPGKIPSIGEGVFIAPGAHVIGDVSIGDRVSIFFGAVLRGDLLSISIGSETNIQEHSMLHTTNGRSPTIVGDQVTIGHRALVHGCTVGNRCLVGMGSIILDDTVIEDECLIGAGTLITEGKRIPAGSMVLGSPGKVVRALTDSERAGLRAAAAGYVETGALFRTINWSR